MMLLGAISLGTLPLACSSHVQCLAEVILMVATVGCFLLFDKFNPDSLEISSRSPHPLGGGLSSSSLGVP
jgi:hypothetical protein